jgi:hypothetical protein
MSATLTIDGKQYLISERNHTRTVDPIRASTRGLTGKHIIVDMPIAATEILEATVLVYFLSAPTGFGTVTDLKAAWAKSLVAVIDVDSTSLTAIPQGKLDLSREFSLVDTTAPFEVKIKLEKVYQ